MSEKQLVLKEIYNLKEKQLKFFLTNNGCTYFSLAGSDELPIAEMPVKLKNAFLLTFIQNHHFAEKLHPVSNIDKGIDFHIKGCHYLGKPLGIERNL